MKLKRKKVKGMVYYLFEKFPKRVWFFSTIADELDLDLKLVVQACEDLIKEGKIHSPSL